MFFMLGVSDVTGQVTANIVAGSVIKADRQRNNMRSAVLFNVHHLLCNN